MLLLGDIHSLLKQEETGSVSHVSSPPCDAVVLQDAAVRCHKEVGCIFQHGAAAVACPFHHKTLRLC